MEKFGRLSSRQNNFKQLLKEKIVFLLAIWLVLGFCVVYYGRMVQLPLLFIIGVAIAVTILVLLPKEKLPLATALVILVFGGFYSVTTPIHDSPDEYAHLARAIRVSEGHLFISKEDQGLDISKDFETFMQRPILEKKTFRVNKFRDHKHNREKFKAHDLLATGSYSGIPYIPQAIGMNIGKLLGLNLLWIYYLGRFFNVICYALFAFFAIRFAKGWRQPLAFISCLPMSVYLAASYNQDGFAIGLGLLIIGKFIHMKTCERQINYKDLLFYLVLCLIMITSKLPFCLLICLPFFIEPRKYANKKTYALAVASIVIVALSTLLWFKLTTGLINIHRPEHVSEADQIKFILEQPLFVIKLMIIYLINGMRYVFGIFTFGWLSYETPNLAIAYSIIFGAMIFFWPTKSQFSLWNRLGLFLVTLGIAVAIQLSMYVTWTAPKSGQIAGLQGRYFILLFAMFPLFLNVLPIVKSIKRKLIDFDGIDMLQKERINNLLLVVSMIFLMLVMFCTIGRYGI